jgi:hypothetical protein
MDGHESIGRNPAAGEESTLFVLHQMPAPVPSTSSSDHPGHFRPCLGVIWPSDTLPEISKSRLFQFHLALKC